MRRYEDALGHVYEVPDALAANFERRRRMLLIAAIVGQGVVLALIVAALVVHRSF